MIEAWLRNSQSRSEPFPTSCPNFAFPNLCFRVLDAYGIKHNDQDKSNDTITCMSPSGRITDGHETSNDEMGRLRPYIMKAGHDFAAM